MTRQYIKRSGKTGMRRFLRHEKIGTPMALEITHPAVTRGTTLFQAMRDLPGADGPILKSGQHNHKIGKEVVKGKWRGMPIFTVTLEERATCPRSCHHWQDCYGNKMPWSKRLEHGDILEWLLESELKQKQGEHPAGFVVRLHVLGDFYSVPYVVLWKKWLERFPALHVFGYTAWTADTPIGSTILHIRHWAAGRFAIRQSNQGAEAMGAESSWYDDLFDYARKPAGIVCPAQTGRTDCCGTCGLCWSTDKNIIFMRH